MPLEKLFIPVSHSLLPTAAAWIFLLEMYRFKGGDDTGWPGDRDQRQIPLPRYIASAMLLLMHLYSKRSLHSLGSNHRAGGGFPRAINAVCGLERAGAFSAWGKEQPWPQPRGQTPHCLCLLWAVPKAPAGDNPARVCPALPAHSSRCCAEDLLPAASGAAWNLGSAERWADCCYHRKKFL